MSPELRTDAAAAVIRASLGAMFLSHGLLKVVVFTLPGTVGYFGSIGLPPILAYGTVAFEILGGIALLAGVGTRWVALGGIPILLGSIVFDHGKNGWLFSAEGGGWEYSAFLIAASVAALLLGDGRFSLAAVLSRHAPRLSLARAEAA